MDQDVFNMELRKFLKKVGITSQREIEAAVRSAIADGRLTGNETIAARVVLTIDRIGLDHAIDADIALE